MNIKRIVRLLSSALLAVSSMSAIAGEGGVTGGMKVGQLVNPNPPSLTVNSTVSRVEGYVAGFTCENGDFTGDPMEGCDGGPAANISYPISGMVRAVVTNSNNGETLGGFSEIGTISATASFSTQFFGLKDDWSVLPPTMPWSMGDDFSLNVNGSILEIAEPLTGRAFPHLGPVENPMETGTLSLRMGGCMGVRETSGMGDHAGKVGTLCLNGTFTFDNDFNGVGVSNCTIALHDPQPGFPVIAE